MDGETRNAGECEGRRVQQQGEPDSVVNGGGGQPGPRGGISLGSDSVSPMSPAHRRAVTSHTASMRQILSKDMKEAEAIPPSLS